jgi:hypothetical protein
MPALAEENEGWRGEGAPLCRSRFPIETLTRIKEAIGTRAWLSLYQQKADRGRRIDVSPRLVDVL